jgi:AcrR family transcriptional regulator
MAHPRFEKLDPQRQQRIIDAAGQEFARSGYKAASLNAIIEAASLSKGSFYYYFDSKEDLFLTVLQHVSEVIFQGEQPDFSDLTVETFWPAIEAMSDRSYAYGREHDWVVKMSKMMKQELDGLGDVLQGFFAQMAGVLHSFLSKGQALGLVRTDVPIDLLMSISQAMDQGMDQWIAAQWETTDPALMKRYIASVFEMTKLMLSPPQHPPQHPPQDPEDASSGLDPARPPNVKEEAS